MTELERDLRNLAATVAFPETPEIAARALRGLSARPPRRTRRRLVWAVVALAVVTVAAGLAVPRARTAILHLIGIGEVQIQFVDNGLPAVAPGAPLDLGVAIDPGDLPRPLVRPSELGAPDRVYLRGDIATLLYGEPGAVDALLMEIPTSGFTPAIGKQLASNGTRVEFIAIRGATGPGVWISGDPHSVQLPGGRPRLAGKTLIWVRNGVTLRLESAATLAQAVAIAESVS